MEEGERKRHRYEATSSHVTRYNERFLGLDELLPGIPNDITVNHISTKLSWNALGVLSSVSRTWRQAIHSRLIYDTRVKSRATETLVIFHHSHSPVTNGIALYSLREKAFYHLPPIPNVETGIPAKCKWVGFDGKIYIFGGNKRISWYLDTTEVYVLDLRGGQRQWKECASMRRHIPGGGCLVMGGKIYVFGSTFNIRTAEVYDPNTDAWSGIGFEKYGRQACVEVATVGEELFMFGGIYSWVQGWAYHPYRLLWKDLQLPFDFYRSAPGNVFIIQGKFHALSVSAISVYDLDTNSWTLLHSFSLAGIAPGLVRIKAVPITDGELLAVVWQGGGSRSPCPLRSFLIYSPRFNSEDKEIVWEKVEYPLPMVMCPVQRWTNTQGGQSSLRL